MTFSVKTTVVFERPFELPGFNETLPAGEYEIESRLAKPADWIEPGTWMESVIVRLHPRITHPGLDRTLTVPLAELEHAVARDKLTGKALTDFFLEEMLADPMIRMVMQADGVAETELRDLYAGRSGERIDMAEAGPVPGETALPSGRSGASPGDADADVPTTDDPIDLDGRRTRDGQRAAEIRRRPANDDAPDDPPAKAEPDGLDEQMRADPARSWVEVGRKWRFLLDRYAATPEAADARVQKLIGRALGDMDRLEKRAEEGE
jgi:hypothetical protein